MTSNSPDKSEFTETTNQNLNETVTNVTSDFQLAQPSNPTSEAADVSTELTTDNQRKWAVLLLVMLAAWWFWGICQRTYDKIREKDGFTIEPTGI